MVSKELIQSLDIANTLQGGISEPCLKFSKHQEFFQIELKVPGIGENNMHVKISNNQLIVFFERKIVSGGRAISIPFVVYNYQIPYFIDVGKIHAMYNERVLVVQLPYNELANGYHRDVPIDN